MGLLDNLGNIANSAVESTKLNAQKAQSTVKVESLYKQLGQQVYQAYTQGQEVPGMDICRQIDGLKQDIAEKDEQKAAIRDNAAAQAPAQEFRGAAPSVDIGQPAAQPQVNVSEGAQASAGPKINISDIPQSESQPSVSVSPASAAAGAFCTNCGAKVDAGTKFCPECGNPM